MIVRQIDNKVFKDDRRYFTFHYSNNQLISTKSVTRGEAKAHIKSTLKIKLKAA